ncbi:MAG: hypothetical protein WA653_18490, partial [Candidatus Sulfotelmatobacter sp.]
PDIGRPPLLRRFRASAFGLPPVDALELDTDVSRLGVTSVFFCSLFGHRPPVNLFLRYAVLLVVVG